jgi:hypothetical protein
MTVGRSQSWNHGGEVKVGRDRLQQLGPLFYNSCSLRSFGGRRRVMEHGLCEEKQIGWDAHLHMPVKNLCFDHAEYGWSEF